MIACDTSSLSAFLKGEAGDDVLKLVEALAAAELCLPPTVLTEMLSDPRAGPNLTILANIDLLPILDGFWERAGEARRIVLALGLKAKVADALIAQACIDHGIALITRDADFRHFARHCGLKLA